MNRNQRFKLHNVIHKDAWSAAIYTRLSDEDRDKKSAFDMSQSIQNQIDYLRNYIEVKNEFLEDNEPIIEYKVYCDDDRTGINFSRDGFREMMRDINAGLVDCIVVKNLSRLGRNDIDMQNYLERTFEQSGKEVRVLAVGDNYDSLYQEVGIDVKLKLIINREYSEIQHRNVIAGMRAMQKKGKFVGAFAPYGYQKDPDDIHHLIPDAVSSLIVQRIFKEYLDGDSPKTIAARLTKDGIVNPSTYKKQNGSNFKCGRKISDDEVHWRSDGVKKILMDEVYTGTLVQHKRSQKKLLDEKPTPVSKDKWIRCEGTHEAIISKEDWDKVQSMMKTIKRDVSKPDEVTIFKGILKCGDCRHAMRKKWDPYKSKKTGLTSKYYYYNCATYRDFSQNKKLYGDNAPTCTSHSISDNLLRTIILDDMNKIIGQVKNLQAVVAKQSQKQPSSLNRYETEIHNKERKIQALNERLKGIKNKWYDGKITDEEYEADKVEVLQAISNIDKEMQLLKNTLASTTKVLENVWIQKLLAKGKLDTLDRATVLEFVDQIYVYEDKHIEIIYKFTPDFDVLFKKCI